MNIRAVICKEEVQCLKRAVQSVAGEWSPLGSIRTMFEGSYKLLEYFLELVADYS